MTSITTVEERAFDDACDLGQCCLDPCYFFYIKTKRFLERNRRRKEAAKLASNCSENEQAKQKKAEFLFTMQQSAYFLLVGGSWMITFLCTFPLIDASDCVSKCHKAGIVVLFLACGSSWLLAAFTPPGTITQQTVAKLDNYRCDGVLYKKNAMCPTMPNLPRPARSKFDRYSSQQVPRFDHFCGWLGQSIGEENYRFFLLFLVVHTFMAVYGTCFTLIVMKDAAEKRLVNDGTETTYSLLRLLKSALEVSSWEVLKIIIMSLALPFLAALLSFHVLLVKRGMTINEHFKWKSLTADGSDHVEVDQFDGNCLDLSKSPPTRISISSAKQFYNLGFLRNIYEVLCPRSLHEGKKNL